MKDKKPTETKPINYDTEPCANCGTLAVKTDVVHGDPINPPATLDGTSLSEGDKVKRCDACGAILTKVATKKPVRKKKPARKKKPTSKKKPPSTSAKKATSTSASSKKGAAKK